VDPGSSSPLPERVPATGPTPVATELRWGLGDFAWIYFGGIVAALVGGSVGFALTGDTSGHVGALTTALSSFGQFGVWFGLIVFVARIKGRSARYDFGLTLQLRDWWAPFAGLALYGVGIAMIEPLVRIANAHQQVADDLSHATGAKLGVVVIASVVAPVCEELLFRGLLLRALRRRMSPEMAVIVQALAFALAHPMLSPTLGDFAVVPALFLLGAVSGIVALRRGDLSASILMHIGFNLVTTLSAL